MTDTSLIEHLAAHCHDNQWSSWMKYLFTKCVQYDDGTMIIPAWAVERWTRQVNTPYTELPESERESDRKEARGILAVVRNAETHCHFIANRHATRVADGHYHLIPPGAVEGSATSTDIPADPDAPGTLLGCTCGLCEFHRSADEIERKRRRGSES